MTVLESLTYAPVELAFGTSGLRGLIADMTDLECYINALGFLQYLQQYDGLKAGDTLYLAGDLRDSTPRIMQVMVAALRASNIEIINGGLVPTPAIAYAALLRNAPCIMVTGSHIPANRNGIKFYKSSGEVLKTDEQAMQACVFAARQQVYELEANASGFDKLGALLIKPALPSINPEIAAQYLARYTTIFDASSFQDRQIVVYQHSAVGRDLLVDLLTQLGAEVVSVERSDFFVSIDTENVTDEDQTLFRKFSTQYPDAFAIVSTDGDSDRPFVIDEKGEFHRGDILGCVVATFLEAQFAAVPISANDAAVAHCIAQNIALVQTKIGSPYVIAAMDTADTGLSPKVAWEVNGGFLTGDDVQINGKTLTALPTRDAFLPILAALLSTIKNQQSVSELFAALPARFTGGGLIDNIPESKIAQYRLISSSADEMRDLAQRVFIDSVIGLPNDVNIIDGLRLTFANGDVIHLRPSGNAPQFRVYTNADSQERADALVHEAIVPGGYIEQLLATFKDELEL